jgi:hypothetical protein
MSSAVVRAALAAGALLSAPVLSLVACDSGSARPTAAQTVEAPEAETVRGCQTAVYGEIRPGVREDAVGAGPLALLLVDSERRAAFEPSAVVKVLALVEAGKTVTLVVPQAERRRLSLLYDFGRGPRRPLRLSDGTSSVRFSACSESEGWSPGQPYPDPRETQFNGGFFVGGAQCASLEAWVERRAEPLRFGLPFGTGERCQGAAQGAEACGGSGCRTETGAEAGDAQLNRGWVRLSRAEAFAYADLTAGLAPSGLAP